MGLFFFGVAELSRLTIEGVIVDLGPAQRCCAWMKGESPFFTRQPEGDYDGGTAVFNKRCVVGCSKARPFTSDLCSHQAVMRL